MSSTGITPHISHKLDDDLEALRNQVVHMGQLVAEQVENAVTAVIKGDANLAREVIDREGEVDAREMGIDRMCMEMIAMHQPAAGDLRFIIGSIKTINDLERMGDRAMEVAKAAMRLAAEWGGDGDTSRVEAIWATVREMVVGAVDAFARLDAERLVTMARQDEAIDSDHEEVMRGLMDGMVNDARRITPTLELMRIARTLVRIGDHATNICEHVVFLVHGKDLHHASAAEVAAELKGR
ncbi:phosphate signaling complex protein PhoU [Endothiovibrio diazotrophicus]